MFRLTQSKQILWILIVSSLACGSEGANNSLNFNEIADDKNQSQLKIPSVIHLHDSKIGFGHPIKTSSLSIFIGHPGANKIYEYDGVDFISEIETDLQSNDYFGEDFGVSEDGKSLLVGAHLSDFEGIDSGVAVHFDKVEGKWQEIEYIVPSDIEAGDSFGARMDLSADGNIAAIASYFDDEMGENAGAVYVFEKQNGQFLEVQKLTASDALAHDNFGFSVAVSGDGKVIAIGSCNVSRDSFFGGAVYIFEKIGETWIQIASFYGKEHMGFLGDAISISKSGNVIASAEPYVNSGGKVHIYTRNREWKESHTIESPSGNLYNCLYPNTAECNYFGYSLDLDNAGNNIVMGASNDGNCRAYLYKKSSNLEVDSWELERSLCIDDLTIDVSALGNRVTISNDGYTGYAGDNSENNVVIF